VGVSSPFLARLGDYGGPTPTIALLHGSAAIGHGAAMGPTTDKRGFALDSPAPDIGAFQSQPALVVNTTIDGVGSPAGELSLRQAVNLADVLGAAAAISFDPTAFAAHQTIALTGGPLELSDTGGLQTITGPAAGLTLDAGGQSRVFQVDGGVNASLSGLTLTGGSTGSLGGGLVDYGTATLTACTITGNSAGLLGGGVAVYLGATATLTGCTISGNSAYDGGLLTGGTTTLTACTISGNSAGHGGGLDNIVGTATLTACTIGGNSACLSGGGTLTFTGTGGTITISGESGAGSTDVFTVGKSSVKFAAADGLNGSTINFSGTGLTRNVVAQGTTNTFNIHGTGSGVTPGSLVGDSGSNAFVFAAAATLAGGIHGGGASTLSYAAYTTGVTVNLGNGTNGTATGVSGMVTGITAVIGGSGNDTLNAGSVPAVALTGGPGTNTLSGTGGGDSVVESLSSSYTLTNTRLTGASPSFVDHLSGIAVAALTGSSSTANSFTVSGWTGTGSLTAPAGTGTVTDSGGGSFALTNAQLTAPNTTLALSGIVTANLTDSKSGGGDMFTVTGWTGRGTLKGTSETVVDATAGGFTLNNTRLSSTAGGPLTLSGFKTANLTDTGPGGSTFTVTGWTGGGTLTGTADTVVDAASGNFTLSSAALSIGSLSMALSGITTANLTDTGSGHTFTLNGWTGGGSLASSVAGNTEKLTASETAGLTLTNASLAFSGGGTMSLASFKAANLTVTTAGGNPSYIIDASAFSNGPANVTVNGGGNAIVYGGTAGKDTLTAAGSGDDILIGNGPGDKLTDSGTGMNILIGGGSGGDTLTGGGNDILVSGTTNYDGDTAANIAALDAILAEWTSSDSYSTRIGKIFAGVGPGGTDALNSSTVTQDGKANTLQDGSTQSQNNNWFLAWSNDKVTKKSSEVEMVL
jgi:hypothetical protein